MRPNYIPQQYFDYSKSVGGVDNYSKSNGGGTIFNREEYIDAYDRTLHLYLEKFDEYCEINKNIWLARFLISIHNDVRWI